VSINLTAVFYHENSLSALKYYRCDIVENGSALFFTYLSASSYYFRKYYLSNTSIPAFNFTNTSCPQ
jgi:hypothetical protein